MTVGSAGSTGTTTQRPGLRRGRWHDPVVWTDVVQLVKTVVAAVVAWVLATHVLDLSQSFLAPWSALLVVHATVYRTFSQGVRQVVAAVAGVVVAWLAGWALGLDPLAVGVAVGAGLVIGAIGWFHDEGTTVAATALIVLTTGYSDDGLVLVDRLLDTAIGIGVGLVVNAVVWPPLRRRAAISALDALDNRIGQLLVDMAGGFERGFKAGEVDDWVERSRDLDEDLDRAWSLVRQARESALMNPRRGAGELRDPREWVQVLRRMEQALAEIRSLARTCSYDQLYEPEWQPRFRTSYAAALRRAGEGLLGSDREEMLAVWTDLDRLVDELGETRPAPRLWPVYGSLVVNLRNLVDAMEEVADRNPLAQPPLPFARLRRRGLLGRRGRP
ncbi:MAG TPA: aromatic acid exporter family protein [Nocardioides sp.]|uniref:FUSC family protein n=1 Tax=Nocardioides sp. TaxID=35761 RepID=UPI002BC41BE4|nr:aromatic acid exporter family protein [Nocardioides sp.]HTW16094.1 aromatic acid exporter family protein [Nocardioides sp.]